MFNLPEDLTASTLDLSALEAEAIEEFDALAARDAEDLTDDDLARMEALAEAVQQLRDEGVRRTAAAADRQARIQAARERLTPVATTTEPEGGDDDGGDDDAEPDGGEVGQPDTAPVPVMASTRKAASVSMVAGATKRPVPRPRASGGMRAAADVPGYATGSTLESLRDAAKAFSARSEAFPRSGAPGYIRSGVALIDRPAQDGLTTDNRDFDTLSDLINEAGRESRLSGGSLVAAGGWCAPSEVLYDLCTTETLDGLIDLPEVQVNRGGIKFTRGPRFADIYADAGFCQTEAEAIAGTAKPCSTIDCPDFEDHRLDVCGICVTAPILTNAGYPELVQRWIEGTLVAREHKESATTIAKMVAIAGSAIAVTGGAGSAFDLLTALEWSATTQKYFWRMSTNATLEVVLPLWARAIIRGDIALKTGRDNLQVSDAEIDAHFANRGVRVQWVYDWQALNTDAGGTPAGNECVAAVPANIEALIYPAGTFIKGVKDVISLDAVYDSTNLKQNLYTAVFAESGILVANRCYDACRISVPTCLLGASGPAIADCLLPSTGGA